MGFVSDGLFNQTSFRERETTQMNELNFPQSFRGQTYRYDYVCGRHHNTVTQSCLRPYLAPQSSKRVVKAERLSIHVGSESKMDHLRYG
ncbi:hypothetical protein M3J09_012250 [Ascochyta lentis]